MALDLGTDQGELKEINQMIVKDKQSENLNDNVHLIEKYLLDNMVKVDTDNKDIVLEVLKYPVTQRLYKLIDPKKNFINDNEKYPADEVRWIDAINFCNTLSTICKKELCYKEVENTETGEKHWEVNENANGYRLPNKIEWFFCANGGIKKDNYKYSGSSQIENVAWYSGNSEGHLHEVGQKQKNAAGLYDMSGNIKEFCWDTYKFSSDRIVCGGSILSDKELCEVNSDNYEHYKDNVPYQYVGFRIIRCVKKSDVSSR